MALASCHLVKHIDEVQQQKEHTIGQKIACFKFLRCAKKKVRSILGGVRGRWLELSPEPQGHCTLYGRRYSEK
eukprot:scaffold76538_cov62-Attheya_sp.AAC.3